MAKVDFLSHKCPVCQFAMPLKGITKPSYFQATMIRVKCDDCESALLIKCERDKDKGQARFQIMHTELGPKGRVIVEEKTKAKIKEKMKKNSNPYDRMG